MVDPEIMAIGTQILVQSGAVGVCIGLIFVILKLIEKRKNGKNGNGSDKNGKVACALDPGMLASFMEATKSLQADNRSIVEGNREILSGINRSVTQMAVFTSKLDSVGDKMDRNFDKMQASEQDLRIHYERSTAETANSLESIEREVAAVQSSQNELSSSIAAVQSTQNSILSAVDKKPRR